MDTQIGQIFQHQAAHPDNFSWFIENKIVAMGCPKTVENLQFLTNIGVIHLVTLSPERVPPILSHWKQFRWIEIPIEEFEAPSLARIFQFIKICEEAQAKEEVVGVHCRQGYGRTGTMLACYLVHFRNMTPDNALHTTRMLRPGSCETEEQEDVIKYYYEYRLKMMSLEQ